jgi:hypothetical protein
MAFVAYLLSVKTMAKRKDLITNINWYIINVFILLQSFFQA